MDEATTLSREELLQRIGQHDAELQQREAERAQHEALIAQQVALIAQQQAKIAGLERDLVKLWEERFLAPQRALHR
jgi:hypothetical protein